MSLRKSVIKFKLGEWASVIEAVKRLKMAPISSLLQPHPIISRIMKRN